MAAITALIRHYLEYLSKPGMILSVLGLVLPFILVAYFDTNPASPRKAVRIPGCLRLGLQSRSNLEDQFERRSLSNDGQPTVKALFTYPVKSCRGVELTASEVQATGLNFDRLFTFAQLTSTSKQAEQTLGNASGVSEEWDHQWRFITQREFPRLALLETELWLPDPRNKPAIPAHKARSRSRLDAESSQSRSRSRSRGNTLELERGRKDSDAPEVTSWVANGGCLLLRFPFEPDINPFGIRTETVTLQIPLVPTPQRQEAQNYKREELIIWKGCPLALNVTNEISAINLEKLKYFLGISNPLALFRVDEHSLRPVSRCLPQGTPAGTYKVGFADAFAVNLMSLASVRATDDELPDEADAKSKLDARRFRANIYVTGIQAFEEDHWKTIHLGHQINGHSFSASSTTAEYQVACRTARCKVPNVNPDTGEKDRNEPYTTLGRTRKVDEGAYPHPCLGMQMIPRFRTGIVQVGDTISVSETGEHCCEKMFK
ncbi:hypothetical protein B0A50_02304 [Salinomyces thailandicus]|uniref:MOSC domain-containing protein n=1 Tax=Salinomyces thailandicus TaxID=706561 RepID=A0A4U0U8S0_9PEZI|nr:hypothetical protein B0A50_02304 [Salinomyces thailandica]